MARARIASAIQSKVGALIYGEQFTGKSTLASEFVYFKRPDGKPFRVFFSMRKTALLMTISRILKKTELM